MFSLCGEVAHPRRGKGIHTARAPSPPPPPAVAHPARYGGGRVFLDPPATSLFLLGFPAGRPCVILTPRVGWPLHSLSPSSAAHSKDCVNVNAPASLCLLCSKRKAPRAATGAQARPAREIRRRCACLPRARLFLVVGSRAAAFSGGGARLAHKKQARRATRTAGAASCVAALVGLGRAAFRRSFSSLIAHRGPICVVLITAHWGLAPLSRGRGLCAKPQCRYGRGLARGGAAATEIRRRTERGTRGSPGGCYGPLVKQQTNHKRHLVSACFALGSSVHPQPARRFRGPVTNRLASRPIRTSGASATAAAAISSSFGTAGIRSRLVLAHVARSTHPSSVRKASNGPCGKSTIP